MNGDVGGLAHVVAAIEPAQEVAALPDDEDGRTDAVDRHYFTVTGNGEPGDDVDVADGDLLDEVPVLGENLHAGALVATVTDHVLARRTHNRHLAWIPQLPLVLARYAELELERTGLLEHLQRFN